MKWPPKQLGDLLADMDALGEALEIAHKTFDESFPHAQSGEDLRHLRRVAAHMSVLAVLEFVERMPAWKAGDLGREFRRLSTALAEVDQNQTADWLAPQRTGKPRLLTYLAMLRGRFTSIAELLGRDGGMGVDAATWHALERLGDAAATRLHGGKLPGIDAVRGWRNRKLWMPATWEGYRQQEHVAHHLLVEQSPSGVRLFADKCLSAIADDLNDGMQIRKIPQGKFRPIPAAG